MSDANVRDERLVELLCAGTLEARDELRALTAEPAVAARVDALRALLARTREAVHVATPPAHVETLSRRILARTTREDLSWRGDLRLIAGYVRQRARESRPVRYLAALLLANLTIGPVVAVAWVLTHEPEPERQLFFHLEPRAEDLADTEEPGVAPLPEE